MPRSVRPVAGDGERVVEADASCGGVVHVAAARSEDAAARGHVGDDAQCGAAVDALAGATTRRRGGPMRGGARGAPADDARKDGEAARARSGVAPRPRVHQSAPRGRAGDGRVATNRLRGVVVAGTLVLVACAGRPSDRADDDAVGRLPWWSDVEGACVSSDVDATTFVDGGGDGDGDGDGAPPDDAGSAPTLLWSTRAPCADLGGLLAGAEAVGLDDVVVTRGADGRAVVALVVDTRDPAIDGATTAKGIALLDAATGAAVACAELPVPIPDVARPLLARDGVVYAAYTSTPHVASPDLLGVTTWPVDGQPENVVREAPGPAGLVTRQAATLGGNGLLYATWRDARVVAFDDGVVATWAVPAIDVFATAGADVLARTVDGFVRVDPCGASTAVAGSSRWLAPPFVVGGSTAVWEDDLVLRVDDVAVPCRAYARVGDDEAACVGDDVVHRVRDDGVVATDVTGARRVAAADGVVVVTTADGRVVGEGWEVQLVRPDGARSTIVSAPVVGGGVVIVVAWGAVFALPWDARPGGWVGE